MRWEGYIFCHEPAKTQHVLRVQVWIFVHITNQCETTTIAAFWHVQNICSDRSWVGKKSQWWHIQMGAHWSVAKQNTWHQGIGKYSPSLCLDGEHLWEWALQLCWGPSLLRSGFFNVDALWTWCFDVRLKKNNNADFLPVINFRFLENMIF